MMQTKEEHNYWAGEPYSKTLGQLITALSSKESLVAVTGPEGIGKSALAIELGHTLQSNDDAVILLQSPPKSNAELQQVCREQHPELGKFAFMVALEKWLMQLNQNQKRCVLIIDNAHKLNAEVMTSIRVMNNLQSATHRLLQVVLLGEQNLFKVLSHSASGGLSQRISMQCELIAMNQGQLRQMMFDLFDLTLDGRALKTLYNLSQGKPGIVVSAGKLLSAQHAGGSVNHQQLIKAIGSDPQIAALVRKQRLKTIIPLAAACVVGAVGWHVSQLPPTVANEPQVAQTTKAPTAQVPSADATNMAANSQSTPEKSVETAKPMQSPPIDKIEENIAATEQASQAQQADSLSDTKSEPEILENDTAQSTEQLLSSVEGDEENSAIMNNSNEVQSKDKPDPALDTVNKSAVASTSPADSAMDSQSSDSASANMLDESSELSANTDTTVGSGIDSPADSAGNSDSADALQSIEQVNSTPDTRPEENPAITSEGTLQPLQIVSSSEQEITQDLVDSLNKVIGKWIIAWQRKDIGGYLDAYTLDFKPTNGESHEQWRTRRTNHIMGVEWMKVSPKGSVEIIEQNDNNLILQIWLSYSSPGYKDETLKELEMVKQQQSWLIKKERNKVVKRGDFVMQSEL